MMLKSNEETKINKRKFLNLDIYIMIILAVIIIDLEFFGVYGETFFRDFSIIFEGGYRISSGQIPYQDFFIPTGPVVFYLQAFFNLLFGTNILSMIIHASVIAIILSTIFYFFVRKEFGPLLSLIFSVFFYLAFNGLTFYPHYNQASFFFFFLNIFLLFKYRKEEIMPRFVFILSAILATLSFYSKQDTGALQIFFIAIYLFLGYKKQWKSFVIYYLIPTLILMFGTYLLLSNLSGFQYWFNLGQFPHSNRLAVLFTPRSILGVVTLWKFYISIFFLFSLLYLSLGKKKSSFYNSISTFSNKQALKLISLFLVIAITTLITQSTSGLTNNSFFMGEPILIFILYLLIKENTNFLKKQSYLIMLYFLIIILVLVINPFAVYGQILLNYKNSELKRVDQGCYKGILMPEGAIEGLKTIRELIEKNDKNFLSMTEYSFLYCDYNLIPPKNLPLWFDEGISFYKENVPEIIKVVNSSKPKIILLQDAHRNEDRNLINKFEKEFSELGYTKTGIVDAAASYGKTYYSLGYTKYEVVKIAKTEAPIIIITRNDLIGDKNSSTILKSNVY